MGVFTIVIGGVITRLPMRWVGEFVNGSFLFVFLGLVREVEWCRLCFFIYGIPHVFLASSDVCVFEGSFISVVSFARFRL